jgi:hypothetical protein
MKFAHTPHERRTDRRRTDAYTHETASAGWREEYEYQSATAQLRADEVASLEAFADGGTTDAHPAPGETHADTTAAEYEIAALEGATVAEVNDRWSADAAVVEAAYVSDIEDRLDGWRSVEDLRDAVTFDALRAYSFPQDRLARVPGGERR